MNNINVCIACDENYAKHAGVTVASILYNSKENDYLNIYILDGGISDEKKDKISSLCNIKNCNINFIKINEELFNDYKTIKTHAHISLPAYYRLKLTEIIPHCNNIKRIIYLDCDTIVCSSLSELFNKEIGDNYIAGVHDISKKQIQKNPTYINTGVVLFDLEKIKKDNIENEFLLYTRNNSETITMGDQEIINEVLRNKIKLIEPEWNVQSSHFINRSSYTKHPKIIHMLSKPWIYASECIHKKEYFKYLQMTPWKLNDKDYKHWTIDNERDSIIAFIKRMPFFFTRKRFYKALFYMLMLK